MERAGATRWAETPERNLSPNHGHLLSQPIFVDVSCLLDEEHNPSRCIEARTARSLSRIDITDL
jgi:hypothetical protein